MQWNSGFIIEVASLEGDNLVVFYTRNASEIWPDKRGSLMREGLLYCTFVHTTMQSR
jgi:hypothetical protein